MAKRRHHLVCQHLEGISATALAQYQDIIREHIKGRHGIYALYKRDQLYYVGLASNLRGRLKTHLRDRHKGLWDRFSVYFTIHADHIRELESLVLRIVKPKGNKQQGKLPGSENLKKQLEREVRKRQHDELEVLMGKKQKVTKKRSKRVKRSDSETVLGPYLDQRIVIQRKYKGTLYKARVRKNGWINFNGYLYRSPTGPAMEICGRSVNGWYFWRYQRAPGDWVPLHKLRK